ncbi:unnamed protein product [Ambrosiozyma monospora]|uniref:Unnamed protein product n=1 Tax=Ambrosiozyma monospora TaxID=43982 RepID=A0ACB5T398_AMBMO|nr:unnamed protein product [Ambrosiozyma monospora]
MNSDNPKHGNHHHILIFTKKLNINALPSQLVNLFHYHPTLDHIVGTRMGRGICIYRICIYRRRLGEMSYDHVALVFQNLEFDRDIFTDLYFKDVAEFVLSKSISMKRLIIDDTDLDALDQVEIIPLVFEFMKSFQVMHANFEFVNMKMTKNGGFQLLYLKHSTSLTIRLGDLFDGISVGKFEQFPQPVILRLELKSQEKKS